MFISFSSPPPSVRHRRNVYEQTIHSFLQGYTFEAESNGHSFTVRVPVGGVERGQKFSVPFLPGSNGYSGSAIPRASVPVGHWKVRFQYIALLFSFSFVRRSHVQYFITPRVLTSYILRIELPSLIIIRKGWSMRLFSTWRDPSRGLECVLLSIE